MQLEFIKKKKKKKKKWFDKNSVLFVFFFFFFFSFTLTPLKYCIFNKTIFPSSV